MRSQFSTPMQILIIVLFSAFSSFPAYVIIDTSIVAQYHCDEGSGSLLTDAGGYGNQVVLYNTSWTAGINGSALVFNGTTSYGSAVEPRANTLDFGSGDFTMSAWINTTSPSNQGYKENIISKGDPFNTGYNLTIEHGIPAAYVGATGLTGFSWSIKPINDGKWHYLVGERKNGVVYLYIDTVFAISYFCQEDIDVTTPLYLGRHGTNGAERYIGKLDEITLYKRALSLAEISANFRTIKQQNVPVLISIPSPSQDRQPRFAWHPAPLVQSYTIDIDTSRLFQFPLIHVPIADTSFVPGIALPFDTIYWFVTCNELQERRSLIDSVIIAPLDTYPTISIPYSPDPTTDKKPRLSWYKVAKAQSYSLMVDTENNFSSPLISIQVSDTFFLPLNNLPLGRVFWKVKSNISLNYSAMNSFTIQSDSVPMLYRFNGALQNTNRPVFKWQPVAKAISYTIQIDTTLKFVSPYISLQTSDTSFVPMADLVGGTTYYWKVSCGINPGIFSPIDTVKIAKKTNSISEGNLGNITANDFLRIRAKNNFSSIAITIPQRSNRIRVNLFTVSGKWNMVREFRNTDAAEFDVNNTMANGMYIVQVNADGKIYSSKIFVRR